MTVMEFRRLMPEIDTHGEAMLVGVMCIVGLTFLLSIIIDRPSKPRMQPPSIKPEPPSPPAPPVAFPERFAQQVAQIYQPKPKKEHVMSSGVIFADDFEEPNEFEVDLRMIDHDGDLVVYDRKEQQPMIWFSNQEDWDRFKAEGDRVLAKHKASKSQSSPENPSAKS